MCDEPLSDLAQERTYADRRLHLQAAREHPREQARIADLMALVPESVGSALDVGARDGYLSLQLVQKVGHVTALDLEMPEVEHAQVTPARGDATHLAFTDGAFDLVLCAEVLEHISPADLPMVCRELARVSRRYVLIGVPYRQDTRVGRTTCASCGTKNPPWGHVNTFDEDRLRRLFDSMQAQSVRLVGETRERTNWLSALLNDWAGNPWGTYEQDEPCIRCGVALARPSRRGLARRAIGKAAHMVARLQQLLIAPRPRWMHILFVK